MTYRSTRAIAIASIGMLLGGGTRAKAQTDDVRLTVSERSNANPSIAAAGAYVGVAWSATTHAQTDIFAAFSRDGGHTFSRPVRANDRAGDAWVSSEFPPRVVLVPRKGGLPAIVVVWTTKRNGGTRLLTAQSTDGGHSFGSNRVVPGSDGPGMRGWESVTVDSTGRVFVLWLDHRDAAGMSGMHHHMTQDTQHAPPSDSAARLLKDPSARAQLSQLYIASLDDRSAKSIARGVCYCCKTSVTAMGTSLYTAWRHVYPGSERDIAFAVSHNDGQTFSAPVHVSADGWHIEGCPESGPAIAVDRTRRVHIAWPAPPDGRTETPLSIFYAVARDDVQFSSRVQLPTRGPAAHVQMALDANDQPLVVWDEFIDGTRHLAMARIRTTPSGHLAVTRFVPPTTLPGQGWPVVARTASGNVVAWVSGASIGNSIRVAPLR